VDLKLKEVYGDYLHHQNDGTHLDGGIKDDALWQDCWYTNVQDGQATHEEVAQQLLDGSGNDNEYYYAISSSVMTKTTHECVLPTQRRH
jgi:hypothetical protein